MAEPHVDQDMRDLGTISWFAGQGPRENQVPYTGDCDHSLQRVVGWGPDEKHYELCQCGDCGARAWSDGRARATTQWLIPAPEKHPEVLLGEANEQLQHALLFGSPRDIKYAQACVANARDMQAIMRRG